MGFSLLNIGCGHTKRVLVLETWLKFPNYLTWIKVGYDRTTGLYPMSATRISCEGL